MVVVLDVAPAPVLAGHVVGGQVHLLDLSKSLKHTGEREEGVGGEN